MENEVYDIIAPWVNVSTWHTNHPLAQERSSYKFLLYSLVVTNEMIQFSPERSA